MKFRSNELLECLDYWHKSIQEFPNIRYLGHADLTKKCDVVKELDTSTRRQITVIKNLFIKFREETGFGRGMAAPQIGIIRRIIVVLCGKEKVTVLVNPKIIKASDELTICEELCMSMGNLSAKIVRPKFVTVEFKDENGLKQVLAASEKDSRVLQHELDHLDGVLYTDRVIKNGLRFVYSMKQFNGIHDVDKEGKCPCGSKDKYKKCCGKG